MAIVAASVLFPLAQMYCLGRTDYRRPADVIVVFGCLVRADGTPLMPLADRVRTGVELYQAGLANRLIFSGGPGEGQLTRQRPCGDWPCNSAFQQQQLKSTWTDSTLRPRFATRSPETGKLAG